MIMDSRDLLFSFISVLFSFQIYRVEDRFDPKRYILNKVTSILCNVYRTYPCSRYSWMRCSKSYEFRLDSVLFKIWASPNQTYIRITPYSVLQINIESSDNNAPISWFSLAKTKFWQFQAIVEKVFLISKANGKMPLPFQMAFPSRTLANSNIFLVGKSEIPSSAQ